MKAEKCQFHASTVFSWFRGSARAASAQPCEGDCGGRLGHSIHIETAAALPGVHQFLLSVHPGSPTILLFGTSNQMPCPDSFWWILPQSLDPSFLPLHCGFSNLASGGEGPRCSSHCSQPKVNALQQAVCARLRSIRGPEMGPFFPPCLPSEALSNPTPPLALLVVLYDPGQESFHCGLLHVCTG